MRTFRVLVTTLSPLVVAGRQVAMGGATRTLKYIPGSVLRGALAGALLQNGYTNGSTEFKGLFENNRVCYGNLYPTTAQGAIAWPLPATAWSCKLEPGFVTAPREEAGHGVIDSLVAQFSGRASLPDYNQCQHPACYIASAPEESTPREPIEGYYTIEHKGAKQEYCKPDPTRRLITRTAMSGRWGTARPGFLYTVEAIAEEQLFSGFIHIEENTIEENNRENGDKLAETLQVMIRAINNHGGLRLGMGRSRGLGQVRLQLFDDCPTQDWHLGVAGSFEQRWQTPELNNYLTPEQADKYFAFAITLYSDAILLDDFGRYQTTLNSAAWRRIIRYVHEPTMAQALSSQIECVWEASAAHSVRNWRFAPGWRKPSNEELAVTRGSVFVCTALKTEKAPVQVLLQHLESTGIGRRRAEGFGQFVVGHPWHTVGGVK